MINYTGEVDEATTVDNATQAANYSNQMSSSVKGVSVGADADHRSTYIYATIHAKDFFDSFRK